MNLRALLILTCAAAHVAAASTSPAASKKSEKSNGSDSKSALVAQILLDRAGFSPGEIDGNWGKNAQHVLATFQQANGLQPTSKVDEQTSAALVQAAGEDPPFTDYVITEQDAKGPFVANIPHGMVEKSKLPRLGYANIQEKLGEKFHLSPELLAKLNPKSKFAAGETIKVPNVQPLELRGDMVPIPEEEKEPEKKSSNGEKEKSKEQGDPAADTSQTSDTAINTETETSSTTQKLDDATITVSKSQAVLTVTDAQNKIIFAAPVTTGSEHDPLPLGEWKVDGIERNPRFSYNPQLFWDAKPGDQKAKIPAGPNSPVGIIWIALTKKHYGIHGTPEPRTVGHTESHGCVRLANWNVARVASLVKPGTKVLFTP
jgi:lipoprotein-anchoring transpeptidase ErfK/SrfK